MYYSIIGILALLIHVIVNYYVLKPPVTSDILPAHHYYRRFLFSVIGYYVTDVLWELLNALGLMKMLFVETTIYYAIMAITVFLWIEYVIAYIKEKSFFTILLKYIGFIFFVFQIAVLIFNFFFDIAFWFGDDGTYYTGTARHICLFIQLIVFLTTAIYMLIIMFKSTGNTRQRHRTIGFFGLNMSIFIVLATLYPLMPFYAIGYVVGTCLLHTFVLEDEKKARHAELEKLLQVEEIQEAELGSARQMAYTDPLTGVKNKNAYFEDVDGIERRIEDGNLSDFGIIVFDVNNLKIVNDTKGHEEGDKYIKTASKLICHEFKHSPIYRIGGDEFVAFLMGEDFKNRNILIASFNQKVEKNKQDGKVVISCGLDEFNPEKDDSYMRIFTRADSKMYERKKELKENM